MKLHITLGHNSSAVLTQDNEVLVGYEEERLSRVKADSSYPVLAIEKILHYFPGARVAVDEVFISHWFWNFELNENKYYRPKHLAVNFPNAKTTSVSDDLTHHDLHAKSVWNFCEGDKSGITIVADGFGNHGECLTIYSDGIKIHKSYEVSASLGLMYQYAVGYLGMKENQDEYKLLGYEQRITAKHKNMIKYDVDHTVNLVTTSLLFKESEPKSEMHSELSLARAVWYDRFDKISDNTDNRAQVAYYVQQVIEGVMLNILEEFKIKNVKVSGGIFYNVKLNNMILRWSDKFEANPLCGDQGCALGFTDVRYDDLYWGIRSINETNSIKDIQSEGNIEMLRGNMEFGPRALGNTTTLAMPTLKQVEEINAINGRDTIMPMAPMVTQEYAEANFEDLHKTKRSKHFMIVAYDFKEMSDDIRGAAHYDSDRDVYTGRIQIAPKHLEKVVKKYGGILINTSLNAHGQPIIYSMFDYAIMKQIQNEISV